MANTPSTSTNVGDQNHAIVLDDDFAASFDPHAPSMSFDHQEMYAQGMGQHGINADTHQDGNLQLDMLGDYFDNYEEAV